MMNTPILTADSTVHSTDRERDSSSVDEMNQEIDAIVNKLLNDPTHMTIELPTSLYAELQRLARADQCMPMDVVAHLVANYVYQRCSWTETWHALCDSVQQQGGLDVPDDEERLMEHMQTIRQEVYDEEYAHLYDHLYR